VHNLGSRDVKTQKNRVEAQIMKVVRFSFFCYCVFFSSKYLSQHFSQTLSFTRTNNRKLIAMEVMYEVNDRSSFWSATCCKISLCPTSLFTSELILITQWRYIPLIQNNLKNYLSYCHRHIFKFLFHYCISVDQ
jgi:hypothetical protein